MSAAWPPWLVPRPHGQIWSVQTRLRVETEESPHLSRDQDSGHWLLGGPKVYLLDAWLQPPLGVCGWLFNSVVSFFSVQKNSEAYTMSSPVPRKLNLSCQVRGKTSSMSVPSLPRGVWVARERGLRPDLRREQGETAWFTYLWSVSPGF